MTFKDGLLYVKGQVVIPHSYARVSDNFEKFQQTSSIGCVVLAAQEMGLNAEQQDALVKLAVQSAIAGNTTGNHNPRNHFVKAKDPYGHH